MNTLCEKTDLAITLLAKFNFGNAPADETVDFLNGLVKTMTGHVPLVSDDRSPSNSMIGYGLPSLITILTDLRDKGLLNLSISSIYEHLSLEKMMALATDPRVSDQGRASMQYFLEHYPGWAPNKSASEQPRSVVEHYHFGRTLYYVPLRQLVSLTDEFTASPR